MLYLCTLGTYYILIIFIYHELAYFGWSICNIISLLTTITSPFSYFTFWNFISSFLFQFVFYGSQILIPTPLSSSRPQQITPFTMIQSPLASQPSPPRISSQNIQHKIFKALIFLHTNENLTLFLWTNLSPIQTNRTGVTP